MHNTFYIAKELIAQEQEDNSIKEDLVEYFLNDKIESLNFEREYLLGKINESFSSQEIQDDKGKAPDKK